MRLLLDTHTFIWWVGEPARLPQRVFAALEDRANVMMLSLVSVWEMQIKHQLGRLELRTSLPEMIQRQQRANNIELVGVTLEHILALGELPMHHGDPFDRLLITQANLQGAVLVSKDENISKYSVNVFW